MIVPSAIALLVNTDNLLRSAIKGNLILIRYLHESATI